MPTARRIVIVVSSVGGGGAERVAVDLAGFLHSTGRQVTLLTLNGEQADAYGIPGGIGRERLEIRREAPTLLHGAVFTYQHLFRIRKKIKDLGPDVVVSFLDQTNIRTIAALQGSGIPVVISERVHPGFHDIGKFWSRMRKLAYPRARTVVVQTTEIANWFRAHISTQRVVIIPNAVRKFDSLAPTNRRPVISEPMILAVGRLTQQKGFDLLLEAFRRSNLADIGWHLTILGEGPDRSQLLNDAREAGIADVVHLPGHVDDVMSWFARVRFFVHPARYEGFPNALLEAMQHGKPCISFDCPSGPRDIIEHGVNGLLVPPEDVGGLTDAILKLANDTLLCERFSIEARRVNTRFSPGLIYQRWLDVLDSACESSIQSSFSRCAVES